jgi:hypothetical protein
VEAVEAVEAVEPLEAFAETVPSATAVGEAVVEENVGNLSPTLALNDAFLHED